MSDLARRFPVYSRLLRLYPTVYQRRYSEQILQTLADMLDHTDSPVRRRAIWLRVLLDLPLSVFQQQASFAGSALVNETPRFVKRNAIISACLFVPFFVFVIVNDATAHGLYHTWVWNLGVLLTWIIVLPALGLVVSLVTLLRWLYQNHTVQKQSWLRSLGDIRHNWPMSALVLLGIIILGVAFFHDSVHCVIGDPVTELSNWHATWRCIQQS